MKKTILPLTMLAIAGSAFAQQAAPESNDLEVGATFAYESHYVDRGIDQSDDNLQTTIDVGYSFSNYGDWGFRAYGQLFYMSPISDEGNKADWTLGTRAVYMDEYFFDLGYRFKSYPNGGVEHAYDMKRAAVNRSNELFFGIGRDVELIDGKEWSRVVVAGTVSYDWNLEQTTWEVSVEKTFDEVFSRETSITIGATYGYITANDWNGDQVGGLDIENDYGYLTVKADFVYNLNNSTDLGLGMRYTYNNDHDSLVGKALNIDANTFWWGVSLTFRY